MHVPGAMVIGSQFIPAPPMRAPFAVEYDYIYDAWWNGLGEVEVWSAHGEVRVYADRPRRVARAIWAKWCADWRRLVRESMPLHISLRVFAEDETDEELQERLVARLGGRL